jgi:hypothetical protein
MPHLASQRSLALMADRRHLLVVNAASDEPSLLASEPGGLRRSNPRVSCRAQCLSCSAHPQPSALGYIGQPGFARSGSYFERSGLVRVSDGNEPVTPAVAFAALREHGEPAVERTLHAA